MKTTIRLLPFLGVLPFLCAFLSYGADPPTPEKGRVLLLEHDRILEGDIERVGKQYRIKRSLGETWVEGERVQCLCESVEAVFNILRSRANLEDPDERLRLARWCHLYGLREKALEEVREAARLRPGHRETQRLLTSLQQAISRAPAASPSTPEPDSTPVPVVDLSAETMNHFAKKVQPILLNACGNCHATGRGGAFKLTRPYSEQSVNRKTVQQNVAAVLAQVNLERPQGSPLLTKSISAHGELPQAPFRNRQVPPFRALEDWVRLTIETNPQLQETARPVPLPAPNPEPAKPVAPPPVAEKPAEPPAAEMPTAPRDAFDPLPFNRKMHPERKD